MTDQEFAAWLAQHGGEDPRVPRGTTRVSKKVPSADPREDDKTVEEVHTTITAADGATITLRRVAPSTAVEAGAQGPVLEGAPYEVVGKPTPPRAGTAASRQIKESRFETENGRTFEVTVYTDGTTSRQEVKPTGTAGGTIVDRGTAGTFIVKADGTATKLDIPAKPEPGKTITVKGDDGATYAIQTDANGNLVGEPRVILPAAPDKPQIVTMPDGSKKQAVIRDGRIVFEPIQGAEEKSSDTSGLPQTRLRLGEIASELEAFQRALDADVQAGKIQKADAVKIMEAKYKEAQTKLNEINAIVGAQKSIYDQEVSQRGQDTVLLGQRLSAATTGFGNALTAASDLNKYVQPGSDAGAKALPALLAMQGLQQRFLGAGPDATPARVTPGPALQALAGIKIQVADGTTIEIPTTNAPRQGGTMSGGTGNGQFTSGAGAEMPAAPPAEESGAMSGVRQMLSSNPPNPFEATNMKLAALGLPEDVIREASERMLGQMGAFAA